MNALVTRVVSEVLKQNKGAKATANQESGLEDDQDNFNFENLNIGEEW